jgi:cytochrome c5
MVGGWARDPPRGLPYNRRMRFGVAPLGLVLLIGSVSATAHPSSRSATRVAWQADDLPEGDGKKILQASCTACHDLTEITKFKGYYSRDDWRDIVRTMIAYGAMVKMSDVEVLVDYLTKNLGKK